MLRFGANLKKLRESYRMTQEQLCFEANLSKNQIGNIERGEVNATISTVYSLSKAFKIPVKDLFDFEASSDSDKE